MSAEISGLVIAKNEAEDLPNALAAWESLCDEIIVVNDSSTDSTREVAQAHGARVIDTCMDESTGFAGLRNIGLKEVETSHVLVFDADERPTIGIVKSIKNALSENRDDIAYRVLRRNNALNGWLDHGRFSSDWQIRLFPSSVRYQGIVHEIPDIGEDMEIVDLNGIVEHFTYRSIGEYTHKMRDYARKQAVDRTLPPLKTVLGIGPINLLYRDGYKDGWRGFMMAAGDVWYEYMIRRNAKRIIRDDQLDSYSSALSQVI